MDEDERAGDGVRLRRLIGVIVEDRVSFTLFRAAIADISSTGMRLISDQYLPKGTSYTFSMKRSPLLVARGEVRWVRPLERDTFQVGVLFAAMPEADRRKLQSFLDIERRRVPTP